MHHNFFILSSQCIIPGELVGHLEMCNDMLKNVEAWDEEI